MTVSCWPILFNPHSMPFIQSDIYLVAQTLLWNHMCTKIHCHLAALSIQTTANANGKRPPSAVTMILASKHQLYSPYARVLLIQKTSQKCFNPSMEGQNGQKSLVNWTNNDYCLEHKLFCIPNSDYLFVASRYCKRFFPLSPKIFQKSLCPILIFVRNVYVERIMNLLKYIGWCHIKFHLHNWHNVVANRGWDCLPILWLHSMIVTFLTIADLHSFNFSYALLRTNSQTFHGQYLLASMVMNLPTLSFKAQTGYT